MEWSLFLLDFVPLLVFVVLDSLGNVRYAVIGAVLAAAVEDSRPVLTGVNMELEGTTLTLAAADGFRLAVRTTQVLEPVAEKLSVIVPARTLQEVERLIDGDDPGGCHALGSDHSCVPASVSSNDAGGHSTAMRSIKAVTRAARSEVSS